MQSSNRRIEELLESLEQNGYLEDLIPTRADNNKIPSLQDWVNRKAEISDLKKWKDDQGVGLICRRVIGVDIDIHNVEDAIAIENIAINLFGKAPCRIGKAPKRLLAYRLQKGEQPIKKKALTFVKGNAIDKIEILGHKQQFVCYGVHPDTKKPYEWAAEELCYTSIEDLSPVTEKQIEGFLQQVDVYMRKQDYELKNSKKSLDTIHQETFPIGHADHICDNPEVLISALESIPNDLEYDDWIRLLRAFKTGVGGSEDHYPVAERWSLQWRENTPQEVRKKWDSFTTSEVSAGTVFWEAKKRGWSFPKVFNRKTPYQTAEAIIENIFTYEGKTTLAYTHCFYIWKDGSYHAASEDEIRKLISNELEDASTLLKNGTDKEPFNPKKNDITEVYEALKNKTIILDYNGKTAPFWISEEYGYAASDILCVENGFLHIPSLSLLPHTPTLFAVNKLPYEYIADAPAPDRFLAFLNDLWDNDHESIECLQMWLGYLLTTDTSQQKILLMTGPPRSGKGTITKVITHLLGRANITSPRSSGFQGFGLHGLIDKPLAIVHDMRLPPNSSSTREMLEALLTISGGDSISIPRKYQDDWHGYLPTRFILCSNEMPNALHDPSGAMANRLVHLRMTKSFLGKENLKLINDILRELPSILNWAIQGLDKLKKQKCFTQPKGGIEGLNQLKHGHSTIKENPLEDFIENHCVVGMGESVSAREVRKVFRRSYPEHKHLTDYEIGRCIRLLVPNLDKKKIGPRMGNKYVGIGLVTDQVFDQELLDWEELME